MRKTIAAFNMTIDGFCDHTAVDPDDEVHDHYTELLNEAGVTLYGRTTFQLMQFWQDLLKKPSGEKAMDDFAVAIDRVPKIVFSRSLVKSGTRSLGWDSATLSEQTPEAVVKDLRERTGKDIYVCSRSLIVQLLNLDLIDELQLCIHPVIAGGTLPLFDKIDGRRTFKLNKTKTFRSGAVIHYYAAAPGR